MGWKLCSFCLNISISYANNTSAPCMPMIQHLPKRAQHTAELRPELLRGSQLFGEAVFGDHTNVAELSQRVGRL